MRASTVSVEHLFVLFALDDELETLRDAAERPRRRGSRAQGILPI
jgi:hypothetical protein